MKTTLTLREIYIAFQGEVNVAGIGAPCIIVRTQGCPIRCYKRTCGILCDTPDALEKKGGTEWQVDDLVRHLLEIKKKQGISLVCLTGGDPLWQDEKAMWDLLASLVVQGLTISIETSGTIPINPYKDLRNVHFVLDYKLASAGIKKEKVAKMLPMLPWLDEKDFIKFVVKDSEDYKEFVKFVDTHYKKTNATLAVGTYWGGDYTPMELFQKLHQDTVQGEVGALFVTIVCALPETTT